MNELTDEVLAELERDCNEAVLIVEIRKSRLVNLLDAARRVRELEAEVERLNEQARLATEDIKNRNYMNAYIRLNPCKENDRDPLVAAMLDEGFAFLPGDSRSQEQPQ